MCATLHGIFSEIILGGRFPKHSSHFGHWHFFHGTPYSYASMVRTFHYLNFCIFLIGRSSNINVGQESCDTNLAYVYIYLITHIHLYHKINLTYQRPCLEQMISNNLCVLIFELLFYLIYLCYTYTIRKDNITTLQTLFLV